MPKNTFPFLIILAIVFAGLLGVYLLSNEKPQKSVDINLTPSVAPTSVIITPVQKPASSGAGMDNFKIMSDGLKIEDLVTGTGKEVKAGDTVIVNYVGMLLSGTKFDSSYDRHTPFTTQIGVGQVIKGWDEGIVGMKVGGKRKLVIPSNLGYGEQGAGNVIPPNSTLVFEIELVDVK